MKAEKCLVTGKLLVQISIQNDSAATIRMPLSKAIKLPVVDSRLLSLY